MSFSTLFLTIPTDSFQIYRLANNKKAVLKFRRYCNRIKRRVMKINDTAALGTSEMLVIFHSAVESLYFAGAFDDKGGTYLREHYKGAIDGIEGDGGEGFTHLLPEHVGRWVFLGFGKFLVDFEPLGRDFQPGLAANLLKISDFVCHSLYRLCFINMLFHNVAYYIVVTLICQPQCLCFFVRTIAPLIVRFTYGLVYFGTHKKHFEIGIFQLLTDVHKFGYPIDFAGENVGRGQLLAVDDDGGIVQFKLDNVVF
jgi:hypothetical protein